MVAVAGESEDLDVVGGDALVVEDLPDGVLVEQVPVVLLVAHRELPAVVPQRGGAVDRRPRRVAVEAQPVVSGPFPNHLGVDDDPALGEGAAAEADAELAADRARAAVGGDHVAGPDALELVAGEVGEHQLDAVGMLHQPQAFVLEQYGDVSEAVDPLAQDLVHRRLVDELLWRVAVAAVHGKQPDDRGAGGVDEVGAGPGLHVGVEPVGQAHLLPDPQHLLVGGDGPGAEVDVRVPLDDHHVEPLLPQQVGCGGAHRAIADDRDVVVRLFGHSGLAPACSVVIVTVM